MTRPAQFTARQWNQWVNQGRRLVRSKTSIQFELGDITLQMIDKRPRGYHNGVVDEILTAYADQIGIHPDTLRKYRQAAIAWPAETRNPEVSFQIHVILSALPERMRYQRINHPPSDTQRWTCNEALRAVGRSPNHPVTQQERIDRVHDLVTKDADAVLAMKDILRRPEVVRQVLDDPSSRHVIRQADRARAEEEEIEEDTLIDRWASIEEADPIDDRRPPAPTPVPRQQRRQPSVDYSEAPREVLEVLGFCTAFYTQMQRIIPALHVAEFDDSQRHSMLASLEKVRASAEWAETVINTGDTTMDEALARLLGGAS